MPVLVATPTNRPECDMRAVVEVVSPAITYSGAQGSSGTLGVDPTAVRLKIEENQLVDVFSEIGIHIDALKGR